MNRIEEAEAAGACHRAPEQLAKLGAYLRQKSPAFKRTDLRLSSYDDERSEEGKDGQAEGQEDRKIPYENLSKKLFAKDWSLLQKQLHAVPNTVYLTFIYVREHHAIYASLICPSEQAESEDGEPTTFNPPPRVGRLVFTEKQEKQMAEALSRIDEWKDTLKRQICTYGNDDREELRRCEDGLRANVEFCERLLKPLFDDLEITKPIEMQEASEMKKEAKEEEGKKGKEMPSTVEGGDAKEQESPPEKFYLDDKNVVLTLDRSLFEICWEGLSVFTKARTVTRAFSLAMLYHQMKAQGAQEEKVESLGYIVDPEDPSESKDLSSAFKSLAEESGKQWKGLSAYDHPPSSGEWQKIVGKSQAFYYSGFERIMARVETLAISPLDLSKLRLLVLNDKCALEIAHRQQSKVDNKKSDAELQLESVFNTALLWSLRGVNALVINQYAISVDSAVSYQKHMVGKTVGEGKEIGEALAAWRKSNRAFLESPGDEEAERKDGTNETKKNDKSSEGEESKADVKARSEMRVYDELNPVMCGFFAAKLTA